MLALGGQNCTTASLHGRACTNALLFRNGRVRSERRKTMNDQFSSTSHRFAQANGVKNESPVLPSAKVKYVLCHPPHSLLSNAAMGL
eukprot:3721354-Amphidinium_carterae.1